MFTVRGIGVHGGVYTPGVTRVHRNVGEVGQVPPVEMLPPSPGSESPSHTDTTSRLAQKAYERVAIPATQRSRLMYARDLISTPVITLSEIAPISDATKLFTEKRFRHVPVVSEKLELVGMLSDRDVLRFTAQGGVQTNKVSDLMSHPVVVASFDTEIREIARVMFEERIGCMPIAMQDNSLGGIVTRSDIIRTLLVQAPLELWR